MWLRPPLIVLEPSFEDSAPAILSGISGGGRCPRALARWMPVSWLKNGGVWFGPPRGQRGGGKGNRRAQRARENLRKRLARQQAKEAGRTGEASAEAGTRTEATSTEQKQKGTYSRRRLRGKQKQLGVTAIAKQAQAKGDATKANPWICWRRQRRRRPSKRGRRRRRRRRRSTRASSRMIFTNERCGNALGGNYEASRLVGPPLVGGA